MRLWFQRGPARRADDPDKIAADKRRVELDDMKLGVRERELKIDAIQRVVQSEPDAVTALEVVAIATHRGRHSPAVYQRRKQDQSPLEAMALAMLQKRLEEDPTEALERILERRERLEDAADRLTGRRGRDDDGETGNTMVDVARALANSPLGEAVGAVLGTGMQQRMAAAAAATGTHAVVSQPVVESGGAGPGETSEQGPAPTMLTGPRPVSFRVGMALRALKAMSPADGARWILSQADQHEQLNDLVGPFIAADPPTVPTILAAFVDEAEASGDATVLEWVPLIQHLRDNPQWTLEAHLEMRALTLEGADDEDLDGAATG